MFKSFDAPATSLRTWITVGVLVSLLSAVLCFAVVIERIARGHAERTATDHLTGLAKGFRDNLDRGMAQHYEQLQVLAGLDQVAEAEDADAVRRALERLQTSFPQFTWIGLASPEGRVVASAGRVLEGADVSARPWFTGARDRPYVGDVHPAVLLEKLLPRATEPWRFVDVATQVRSASGRSVGVLGAHLSWTWAREVKRDLMSAMAADHSIEALVLTHDGTVVLGPPALEGKRWAPGLAAHGDFVAEEATRGYGRYPGLGWTIVVRQPREAALADYHVLQRQIAAAALLLLVACLPFTRWIASRLSLPLVMLAAAIRRHDHLDGRALPAVHGYREVGLLSDALAELAERQRAQDAALRELNASLEQRVAERTRQLSDMTAHLERLTRSDALTGLANRRQFEESLPLALARTARTGRPMALLFLDIDRFKQINDALGHAAGDEVLKTVAERLTASVRETDTVARLAGDEFVIILEGMRHGHEARLVANKILRALHREMTLEGEPMRLSASIGVALHEGSSAKPAALMALADKALYEAKAAGRNTFRCAQVELPDTEPVAIA